MGVPVHIGVGLRVDQVKMVMLVRGQFRRRPRAMGVIVSVRAGRGRVHFMSHARQHLGRAVRETHLYRSPDSRPLHRRLGFGRGGGLRESTIALGQPGAHDYAID